LDGLEFEPEFGLETNTPAPTLTGPPSEIGVLGMGFDGLALVDETTAKEVEEEAFAPPLVDDVAWVLDCVAVGGVEFEVLFTEVELLCPVEDAELDVDVLEGATMGMLAIRLFTTVPVLVGASPV